MKRSAVLGVLVTIVASAWLAGAAAAATGPAVVGAISNSTTLSGTASVAVSGNYAYAASYWSGQLNVIDLSNPASPTLVASTASMPQMIGAVNVTIVGTHAFVTSKNQNGPCAPGPAPSCASGSNDDGNGNSLTVVDISNPLAPVVVPVHTQSGTDLFGAYAVAISGNYAYVASQGLIGGQPTYPDTSTGSFSVIDLATGAIVATIQNSPSGAYGNWLDHATGVSISGNYAYVTSYKGQRLTPVVASLSDPHLFGAYRVRVRGNFAFVSAPDAASVATIDVSNPSAPRLVDAVTDSRLDNVDGLAISSTGRYLIATAPRLPADTATTYPPYPLQTGGPANTGTVSVIDLEPSPLSVVIAPTSEPANPTTRILANFSFAVSNAVTTVQCSLDGAALSACTTRKTASYGSLGNGTHNFTVQATDATGATARATYTWTIGRAPVNTSAPKLSGTAQQGRKLTVPNGVWSGTLTPTYSYRWVRCSTDGKNCTPISNQIKSSYTVTVADVGSRLEAVVKATSLAGFASATSAATKTVKWSSSAFASATLSKSNTTRPGFSLSIPAPGGDLKLSKLVILLPHGLSFVAARRALAAGTSSKDLHGRRLSFTAKLSRGKLTLTFKQPPTGVKLTVSRGLVLISSALASRIESRKAKSETVSLTLDYIGKPPRRGAIKFRLA
jgi:hypothetical protein